MKRVRENPGPGNRAGEVARKQLIRREMRFVLQQDVCRFTRQLLARLLDEGCNLHPDLARTAFYEHFERRLASLLPADIRSRFYVETIDSESGGHRRHHGAVKYFLTHLPDAEAQVTGAVLEVIKTLKQDWQHMAKKCFSNADSADTDLHNLIGQISRTNPDGKLAQHGLEKIRRRLTLAVVASLLRHVRNPDLLREKYGNIPQILQNLGRNPALFAALMADLKTQIPYAEHVVSQSFWRTLINMDSASSAVDTATAVK